MASGGARRGRRDNGLVAAVYAAAGDVDPRVGEHLLDVLGLRGIAAYLQPAADLHPVTRTTTLPSRPTDRLYVDRDHLSVARDFLAQLAEETAGTDPARPNPDADQAPGSADEPAQKRSGGTVEADDLDSRFAGIVAGFDADLAQTQPPWPAAEEISDPATHPEADLRSGDEVLEDDLPGDEPPRSLRRWSASTIDPHGGSRADEPSLLDGLDTFGTDLPEAEDEEGYTPPPPPPLPRISSAAILSLLSIAIGLVVFLKPGLLPADTSVAMVLGFAGILGGFAGLIWRLRSGDDDDRGPDDGAVV
ncbi:MAG: DUF308 domain-containing protein [Micromonosporaceae bacterium]|nr:DUF308 domain-containing protein [Micromonosporaceae bacterium]